MINWGGKLQTWKETDAELILRAAKYGDGAFETMRAIEGSIAFLEDHYFRLMATMRVMRMPIPMEFTPEFIQAECSKLLTAAGTPNAVCRFQAVRSGGGALDTTGTEVHWWIEQRPVAPPSYELNAEGLVVDLYKDHLLSVDPLATFKTSNALPYVLGKHFATEMGLDDVLLVNTAKGVVEATSSNIFVVKDGELITPPITEGALRGIIRKQLLLWAKDLGLTPVEAPINPFSLQKADEIWLTNAVKGIQWVGQYRKASYSAAFAEKAMAMLQEKAGAQLES